METNDMYVLDEVERIAELPLDKWRFLGAAQTNCMVRPLSVTENKGITMCAQEDPKFIHFFVKQYIILFIVNELVYFVN